MAVTKPTHKLTYRDYLEMPDDGKRYELIEGELYEMPAPTTDHQGIAGELSDILRPQAKSIGGRAFFSPIDVYLAEDVVVQPDLLLLGPGKQSLISRKGVEGPPDLVVEILSPSNSAHDLLTKDRLYADAGVPEYWVVSPEARTIEVRILRTGVYEVHVRAGRDEPVTSPLLPGLSFPASRIFQW